MPLTKEKLKKNLKWISVGSAGAVVVIGLLYVLGPHLAVACKSAWHAASKVQPPSILKPLIKAAESVQHKVEDLRRAELESDRLSKENAYLRIQLENLRFGCHETEAKAKTEETGKKLHEETGSVVGRTLSSVQYQVPTHLLPPQLYTLALTYFKAHEDEKAAVILSFLTGLKDNDAYKTSRNHLLTGISWYRLDHFEAADHFFERVLLEKDLPENLQWQAQARLWRALVAQKTDKSIKAQYWMLELVDHHPQSKEASWINPQGEMKITAKGVDRAPAEDAHSDHYR